MDMNICSFLPFAAEVVANSADGRAEFFFQVHVNVVILLKLYLCKDYFALLVFFVWEPQVLIFLL